MAEIKYEIIKKIGVLSKSPSGWEKQLNLVSWNDRDPKYDIREWAPDGEKMGKGVTLNKEELVALKKLLEQMDLRARPASPYPLRSPPLIIQIKREAVE